MFIRQCFRKKDGQRHAYWALVESYRTHAGPRQRVVAWLGKLDQAGRLGVEQAARRQTATDEKRTRSSHQQQALFDLTETDQAAAADPLPQWIEVDAAAVRVENCRQFGAPWLTLEVVRKLQLDELLKRLMPTGKATIAWWRTALILVVARLCDPSSELYVAERWYPKSALPELLGVPAEQVDDNRLYRTLDQLLPHKSALEAHLKQRLGELFELEYDLLMYDVTSTYFEGQADFELAQRGYSRDNRSDCKQVCIGLVVSRCGMPLGYEVFAGNTADVTTVEQIVKTMEDRYGTSNRIWVMDRGMVSEANIEFLLQGGRRYIVGTPKSMLKKFEAELLKDDWTTVRNGLEVKLVSRPSEESDAEKNPVQDSERFILCRSRDRSKKEAAMVQRVEMKIEQRLTAMTSRCEKQGRDPMKVEREIGRLLGQQTRAARLFDVQVETSAEGFAIIKWKKVEALRDWAALSAGCYLLRTNVLDWTDEELWKAYMQLTEAEAAFRIHKSDLRIRPIWHQKQERVLAHIFVCFLAFVLWKTLGQMCERAGLGNEPRRVLEELSELRLMDVVLPTRYGIELRKRCLSTPTDHQQILLDQLKIKLPKINQNQT